MSHSRAHNYRHLLLAACLYGGTAAADLSDALQATLQKHSAVAGEEAQVDAKRHAADAVRSERYPSLIAQAQQYGEGGRSASGEDLSQPYLFRVRQPVWAFGRIDNNIAVADAEVTTQRADFLRICRRLLEETAVAYATVRGTAQHIEVAQQNVSELEELFAQIQRRVAGQLASSADERLAAARLAEGKALLERAVSEWEGAKDDLLGFTQVEVDTEQPVSPELLELHEPTDLIAMAIDRSAESDVKRRQLGQAEMEVNQARTASMPTIYLQADRYYDQPGLNDDSQASVVFEASLDGMGFAARGRREEAVSSRAAATQDLAAAKVDLTREVKHLQRGETITLLCSSACVDPSRCHRTIVKALIENAAFPPVAVPRKAGIVRRRL